MSEISDSLNSRFANQWVWFYRDIIRADIRKLNGDEYKCLCPLHKDNQPSFNINNRTGVWYCHGCKLGGDAIEFYKRVTGLEFKAAAARLAEQYQLSAAAVSVSGVSPSVDVIYNYTDFNGITVHQTVRMKPKQFWQRGVMPDGTYTKTLDGIQLYPYNIVKVIESDTIVIVEGEKDADRLAQYGYTATTNAMGAGKWKQEYNKYFTGKSIILVPDNDKVGFDHMMDVGRNLTGIAKSIRVACIDKYVPDKGDISDYINLADGRDREMLKELFDSAIGFNLFDESSVKSSIRQWAGLSPGSFTVHDVDKDLAFDTPEKKLERTKALEELVSEGVLERTSEHRGSYRPHDEHTEELDFMAADDTPVNICLPLGLHNMVDIMPGNVIIIAGGQNAGKTGLLLNMVRDNLGCFKQYYFSSEMDSPELKKRLKNFSDTPLDRFAEVKWIKRSTAFADVIVPGHGNINYIDYLEIHDSFYLSGLYIKQIFDKLNGAIAVIAVQKNDDTWNPVGGSRSKEKARLILSMNSEKIRILKAKNCKNGISYTDAMLSFTCRNGCDFTVREDWSVRGQKCAVTIPF